MSARPPNQVLAAFGASGSLVPLTGGRGRTWRAGDIILKPADLLPEEHAWQADVLPTIELDGFRLALPRRTDLGTLVVGGWAAWDHLDGAHLPARWVDSIEVGRRFHRAAADLPRPAFMAARNDPWSIADRVAWGEAPVEPYRDVPWIGPLADRLEPVVAPSQIVHGDLTGNVLFAAGFPPAIIDLSPYWRPPAIATAIVVADALVWEGADRSLVGRVRPDDSFGQYLARAVIFRLVSASIGRLEGDDAALASTYRSAVEITIDEIDRR